MIKFNSINITNFLSIESLEFEFKPGRHLIQGRNNDSISISSNGAGKSSLIEAIPYVLYREFPRRDVCKRGQKDCSVSLNLDINNKNYIITKYNNHSSHSGVEITVDGENVTSKGVRQTEKTIINAIGLPYPLFTSSIIIPQGYPVNISQMTPTVRKNIIESLLGLLIWEEYQTIFTAASKEYESKLIAINSQFLNKKEQMVSLYNRIKGLKEFTEDHLSEIKDKIKKIKQNIASLTKKRDLIDAKIQAITIDSIETLNDESNKLIYKTSQYVNQKNQIENSLISKKCYACSREYTEEEIDNMKSEVKTLDEKIQQFKGENDKLKVTIRQVQELLHNKNIISQNISNYNSELTNLHNDYQRHSENNKIVELEEELELLTEEVNSLKDEVEAVEKDKDSLSFICTSLQPSSKFRTKLVGSYIQVLNNIIEEVTSFISREFEIQLISSTNEAGIDISITNSSGNINYYSLSGGEKRRIDVILTLSIQKFLLESSFTDSNLLIFDEIFDNLDSVASNTVLTAINNLFGDEKCIYVISHNDAIKSMFDSTIMAEKEGGTTVFNLMEYV